MHGAAPPRSEIESHLNPVIHGPDRGAVDWPRKLGLGSTVGRPSLRLELKASDVYSRFVTDAVLKDLKNGPFLWNRSKGHKGPKGPRDERAVETKLNP
jgi:hypothetical protein